MKLKETKSVLKTTASVRLANLYLSCRPNTTTTTFLILNRLLHTPWPSPNAMASYSSLIQTVITYTLCIIVIVVILSTTIVYMLVSVIEC